MKKKFLKVSRWKKKFGENKRKKKHLKENNRVDGNKWSEKTSVYELWSAKMRDEGEQRDATRDNEGKLQTET